ncbi:MAG: 3-dehydroquinate synthase [Vampirovibrionales bacterium]|nr:3-dehydroquinate synthase [Vampirovibrionales bacterium]
MSLGSIDQSAQKLLRVQLPSIERGYDIVLQRGLLQSSHALQHQLLALPRRPKQVFLISQEVVSSRYSQALCHALEALDIPVSIYLLPQGEDAKSLSEAEVCYHAALESGLTRSGLVIALGGGIVGDLAGFIAATFARGVPFLQIPTTLLAQIDSSVGGKVAVNLSYRQRLLKNAVGVFYQPQAVWIDPDTLATLPPRELLAGLAELTKYAFIEQSALARPLSDQSTASEPSFLDSLEHHAKSWASHLDAWILRCCQIKLAVVERDETEQMGLDPTGRVCLNLGHTFGHALESVSHHGLLHGEAVALGMRLASHLSHQLGLLSAASYQRVHRLLDALNLAKVYPAQCSVESLIAAMRHDKKNPSADEITLILPQDPLGHVVVCRDIAIGDVRRTLSECLKGL